jgi:glycosyltransferase involved in cell wall biosynthesis
MEIAFIHPSWPGDEGTGATYTATQVVTGLAERGHDVTVYCTEEPSDETEISSKLSLEYLDCSGFPYHTNSQLNRALKSRVDEFNRFDVTNCYLPAGLPAMQYISERTSSATGVTLNAYGAICPKNDLQYMDEENCIKRSLTRCAKCISATSPGHDEFSTPYRIVSRFGNLHQIRQNVSILGTVDFFRSPSGHVKTNYADFGFPSDRIHVIPHPLNESFLVDHESDFQEPYRLLYVGYLEKHKGVDKLIPILDKLQKILNQKCTLTVVGKGGLRSEMEQQASDFGLRNVVDFKGFVPNEQLPTVYANHDLFVYPGVWDEPLARVYLEALSTGTPIVTSEYGNIQSIVGEGGITTDGSINDFALVLESLISNKDLKRVSKGAKKKSEEYKPAKIVESIEQMYKDAL